MSQGRAVVVGCGFVGEAAADRLHAAGWDVEGWTASEASAAKLLKPYPVAAHDVTDAEGLRRAAEALGRVDGVVDCVSSGRGGAESYRRVYLEGARALLAAFAGARLVFTSSTSVYAQTDGKWVDEQSPAEPTRETGVILRETEDVVRGAGGIVLRLAGLYGPGRSALLRKTREGTAAIEGDGGRWMNFCHREDAATAIVRAMTAAPAGSLYNVVDDAPVTQGECVRRLAEMHGLPPPPSVPPDFERKRGWTSKRIGNGQLRGLGWVPGEPSFLGWAAGTLPPAA